MGLRRVVQGVGAQSVPPLQVRDRLLGSELSRVQQQVGAQQADLALIDVLMSSACLHVRWQPVLWPTPTCWPPPARCPVGRWPLQAWASWLAVLQLFDQVLVSSNELAAQVVERAGQLQLTLALTARLGPERQKRGTICPGTSQRCVGGPPRLLLAAGVPALELPSGPT
jgi:hypothetical protein